MTKTCPFCNSTKPRPDRSRVTGLRAEEFGDLVFSDHGSTKIGDKTFGFLIVLDGATSHLTAYPCKSTFPSEVISKLHEWMDTFKMNPKAICADMAFHHPHDMQAFHRMHNVKRLSIGPHTLLGQNRAEMGCSIVQEMFVSALVDTVKGMYPAPDIHEHFTIHKWLRQTAYILTHNMNNLEHIANNCTDTTRHTDVYNAQF